METARWIAANRFGLGPRGDAELPSDPRAWLTQQLERPAEPWGTDELDTAAVLQLREEDRINPVPMGETARQQKAFREAVGRLGARLVATEMPFRERLTLFWCNHFSVSRRGGVGLLAMPFMRDAIAPHTTGRFADMFRAVMQHPAMLDYLNASSSLGPNSVAGRRQHRGLNENLAREAMELHSVSPASGYSQGDVTAFAAVLTGWTVATRQAPWGFEYRAAMQEPGEKRVMGTTLPEGEAGGLEAIEMLGTHPATYRHIAFKLARHFVADTPPPALVVAMAQELQASGGVLLPAYQVLLRRPEAWAHPLSKLRTPQEFLLAAWRLLPPPDAQLTNTEGLTSYLGQPFFGAAQPDGWADDAADWAGPEMLLRRVDWSWGQAGRFPRAAPADLLDLSLGPLASEDTRQAVLRAGSTREALTLLLSSPEFQRR